MEIAGVEVEVAQLCLVVAHDHGRRTGGMCPGEALGGDSAGGRYGDPQAIERVPGRIEDRSAPPPLQWSSLRYGL